MGADTALTNSASMGIAPVWELSSPSITAKALKQSDKYDDDFCVVGVLTATLL